MAREGLDKSLEILETELILMSGLAEKAVTAAIDALVAGDVERARSIRKDDDVLDDKQREIEQLCVDVIRREAPIAGDLRRILSAIRASSELERIGDYANGIARITIRMSGQEPLKKLEDIPKMARMAVSMLKDSMELHRLTDPAAAKGKLEAILAEDDKVDSLYEQVVRDLMEIIRGDPDKVERGSYLMWVAHIVERIADRTENIAEMAYYQVTGENYSKP